MAKRKGIMTPYLFEEKRLSRWPWIVQPKVEGDRRRALMNDEGEPTLLTSSEAVSLSTPHIEQEIRDLDLYGMELDGEVFKKGKPHSWIRERSSRTVNLHPDYASLEYHIFDLPIDGLGDQKRQEFLDHVAQSFRPPLFRVPWFLVWSLEEAEAFYERFLDEGYEGIIFRDPLAPYVRKKTTTLMKLKPRKQGWYRCIGWDEEVSKDGVPKGTLGSLRLLTQTGTPFSVGSGFTAEQRQRFWLSKELLEGTPIPIRYQSITSKNEVPKMLSFDRKAWAEFIRGKELEEFF